MLNKLKNLFKTAQPPEKPVQESPKAKSKVKIKAPKKEEPQLSEKEQATRDGNPYVTITKVEVDPTNINAGAFELDWNDKFILNLIRAGYKQRPDDTDQIIVDRWFQTVCRNIALEVYEQKVADPTNRESEDIRRVQVKNLGDGRSEIS